MYAGGPLGGLHDKLRFWGWVSFRTSPHDWTLRQLTDNSYIPFPKRPFEVRLCGLSARSLVMLLRKIGDSPPPQAASRKSCLFCFLEESGMTGAFLGPARSPRKHGKTDALFSQEGFTNHKHFSRARQNPELRHARWESVSVLVRVHTCLPAAPNTHTPRHI